MTQRIQLDGSEQNPRPVNPRRDRNKKRWYMTKKEKITLITLGSVTAVLLVTAIIMLSTMFAAPADDGKILKGVVAAGVPLGGMTKEQAAAALEEATANTYTKNDMTVEVLNEKITLTPLKTGARLDIPSVVDAAYNYGRTGSRADRERAKTDALSKSVTISVIPYLNLDTDYIRDQINALGAKFSTTLEQGSITLTGQKPSMDVSKPDITVVYQTLEIYVGTAEYILDTNKLYDQVLEYYNTNIFKVVGECKVMAPDSIEDELLLRHTELYTAPENAQEIDGEIIPEKYGYGFDLEAVKEQIAQAPYGGTITVELKYIMPDWTEELIASGRYKDVLGEYSSTLTDDTAWNNNATLAIGKLNSYVVKPGDVFSFNKVLGTLVAEDGYLEALAYKANRETMVLGGGVTHAASVLYNCVLAAEMEILEYHNHPYAIDFIEIGRDAYVDGDKHDFRFKNNSADPIMIIAEATGNTISIRIEGIDSRDYEVTIDVLQEVIEPGELYHYMSTNNAGGYIDGEILFPGVNGYTAKVQLTQTHKTTGQVLSEKVIEKEYAPQDSIVVSLKDVTPIVPPVTNPDTSEPPASTGPQGTNPSSGPATEPSN